jgi:hypothetical protein
MIGYARLKNELARLYALGAMHELIKMAEPDSNHTVLNSELLGFFSFGSVWDMFFGCGYTSCLIVEKTIMYLFINKN